MARNNTRINLDVIVNSIGATLGGGSTTERKLTWTGSGDMTFFSHTNATYQVPNLTASPTPPSSIADTLIGYSSYSPTASGNFTGSLLYGGPLTPPSTNVAPSLLAIGAPGQVLDISG